MAEDVGEAGVEVAVNFDFGNLGIGAVGGAGEGGDGFCAALNDVLCVALDKDLPNEIGFGEFSAGREVWGIVCFCEGKVLFGNDAAGYALQNGAVSGCWKGEDDV